MTIDWAIQAEDDLARLDERLAESPVRDGWIARSDFFDACASIWLEGGLLPLEDLVLHDALADIKPPTPDLTRARTVANARRRICAAAPGWAMTRAGCDALTGQRADQPALAAPLVKIDAHDQNLDAELAAIDALLVRTSRALSRHAAGIPADAGERTPADRFEQWAARVDATSHLSSVRAAATAILAWQDLRPLDNADWLGRLLAADLLRERRKTRVFLCPINMGLKSVAQNERRSRDPAIRLQALLKGFAFAAEQGLRDHDRWRSARQVLERKTLHRRMNSHLPELIELVMARPLVTAALIATELKISERSARDLVTTLQIREMTGRMRYRAWGVI